MTEHPFAKYIRIIGRGPNLSRPLDESEMYDAAKMILNGDVDRLQLGAFLCILRMRTEVPGEGAGFVRAVRDTLERPSNACKVDLDWPTYSGKKRQLPWYLLAALLLSQNGITICMQGTDGHTQDRIFSSQALKVLGVISATSLHDASDQIRATNFAYLPLKNVVPVLQDIIELKSILGVRSPVNTFARMINPLNADHELQTVFHANYRDVHRDSAALLGQKHMAVFKGEGGEAERRPHKPVVVQYLHDGLKSEEEWPPMLPEHVYAIDEDMDLDRLPKVWDGSQSDVYGEAAVIGTVAYVLRLMGKSASPEEAIAHATKMWDTRIRTHMFQAV
ncbi:MAG: glycosyl transferase family protein [Magnetovibrio sp.]|nr:glycosyl transferase family protein [Magnetovibrio sp.]